MQLEKQQKNNDPKLSFHLMKFAVQDYQKNSSNLTEDEYNQAVQHANEEMLLHQVILTSNEACGVVIPDSILQQALNTVISEYPDDDTFHTTLAANNLEFSEYRQALHNDLRVETILGKVASTVQTVTPSEMWQYYKGHTTFFDRPEQRKASLIQIFTKPCDGMDPTLTTITEIHERLCQHPENFGAEAKNYSDCDTAKDGGKLGILATGELCKELDSTLFSLSRGEISPVIATANAYHILQCNAIYPPIHVPFEEAKSQILPLLLKKKQLNACRLWLQSLMQTTKQD